MVAGSLAAVGSAGSGPGDRFHRPDRGGAQAFQETTPVLKEIAGFGAFVVWMWSGLAGASAHEWHYTRRNQRHQARVALTLVAGPFGLLHAKLKGWTK